MGGYRSFTRSRWWTRGWTLQELIAPTILEFYSAQWIEIGTKLRPQEQIPEITGIDGGILRGADPMRRNVAVRMSWPARRLTTRVEDQAYCLMGLFGVNMPLLYGEGERAFIRLQEELVRVREDYTLFAWSPHALRQYQGSASTQAKGLLAESPYCFTDDNHLRLYRHSIDPILGSWSFGELSRDCSTVLTPPPAHNPPQLTSRGPRIFLPLLELKSVEFYVCLSLLHPYQKEGLLLCVILHRLSTDSERYIRRASEDLITLPRSSSKGFKFRSIYVTQPPETPELKRPLYTASLPSFVCVRIDLEQELPLRCRFASWINMESMLLERAIVSSLINLNYDATVSLSMGHTPELCWFPGADNTRIYRTSGVRGVLGFVTEDYPNSDFVVQLGLYEERPLCDVTLTSSSKLQDSYRCAVFG